MFQRCFKGWTRKLNVKEKPIFMVLTLFESNYRWCNHLHTSYLIFWLFLFFFRRTRICFWLRLCRGQLPRPASTTTTYPKVSTIKVCDKTNFVIQGYSIIMEYDLYSYIFLDFVEFFTFYSTSPKLVSLSLTHSIWQIRPLFTQSKLNIGESLVFLA